MSDALKDVVKSPWFEWRDGLWRADEYGTVYPDTGPGDPL